LDRMGAVSQLINDGNLIPSKEEVDLEVIRASVAKMHDPALRILGSWIRDL
jgi:hypothetical protein